MSCYKMTFYGLKVWGAKKKKKAMATEFEKDFSWKSGRVIKNKMQQTNKIIKAALR